MRYLGLDLGSRTLGIALSDQTGLIASNYGVIRHKEEYSRLVNEVTLLVDKLKVEAIVLGFPKNMNNSIGPKGELSIKFKKKLEKKLSIPIYLQDERLSTKSATDMLILGNVSRKSRKKVVDGVAATIILQSYLDKERRTNEKNSFSMIDENGNEIVYDVLFTFESEETHKNYIVYTDNTKDENGNVEVYASIYDPNDPHSKLEAIETEKEWKVIETILETLQEEVKKQMSNQGNQNNEQ